jgi:hypothetical protein
LQLFNIIRNPLIMFPIVMSSVADAVVALQRISKFLNAEELPPPYEMDLNSAHAVRLDANFTWEEASEKDEKTKSPKDDKKKRKPSKKDSALPVATEKSDTDKLEPEKPFTLNNLKMTVAKGSLVAVRACNRRAVISLTESFSSVGGAHWVWKEVISTGQTRICDSLLIPVQFSSPGNLRRDATNRRTSRNWRITRLRAAAAVDPECHDSVSLECYCTLPCTHRAQRQHSLRCRLRRSQARCPPLVLIARTNRSVPRFRAVVKACSLEHDFDVLPHHELTEIGERGINL